jgi:hypothetical protein
MRRLSKRSLVAQLLMIFLLLSVSVFGKSSTNKGKTNQAKTRISKKLELSKPAKSVKTGNQEVDQAQALLDSGITRLSESLECS